jgi:hypothetical protein
LANAAEKANRNKTGRRRVFITEIVLLFIKNIKIFSFFKIEAAKIILDVYLQQEESYL